MRLSPRSARRAGVLAAATVAFLVGTLALGAGSAHADPTGDWQVTPSTGLQYAVDSGGVRYPYLVMPTGGRWFLECPLELDPSTDELTPSIRLDLDHDRCGNDQGATHTYPGATWTTSTYASVNVDPQDVRCGQLIAHRADAIPPDAVSPPFCNDRVLVYPTLNGAVAHALATWWPDNVLDTCPPPVNRSSLACGPKDDGRTAIALQWWHGDGHGGVNCARIPLDHIPAAIATWAAGDSAEVQRACQLLNNYFTGAPLSFAPSTDMLAAVRSALQESGPAKQPPWSNAVRGKDVKTSTSVDWNRVAGAVGGCLAGGIAGGLLGPAGMLIGCVAGGAAGVLAANWLEGKDCALTSWHCIVNAVSRWMANGLVDELKFAMNQLVHGLNPASIFGQDIFVRLWLALALISALLAALYGLLSLGVSMAVLRPSIAMTTVRNIAFWGWGLVVAIPFTKLVLAAVDGVTTTITTVGAGESWPDLAARFQSAVSASLDASAPSAANVTVSILLFLMLILGGIAALFLAAYALGRSAGIALAVLGIPISLAGIVGPPALRRGPQLALATLFGLIIFKPLVAVVFLLGIGLMGTGASLAAFIVGVLCVLGATFAPWKIIRLFGAGIDHVAHGAAGHTAVVAGAVVTTGGARTLYRQSRGLWHSSSGRGGPAIPGGTGNSSASNTPPGSPAARSITAAGRATARAAQPPTTNTPTGPSPSGLRTPPPDPAPPRVAHSPGSTTPSAPSTVPQASPPATTPSDLVARHRETDR